MTEVFGEEVSHTNDVCDPNYDSEDEQVSLEMLTDRISMISFVC